MSIFGLITLFSFMVVMGGLVVLEYGNNSDLPLAKVLLVLLRLLIVAQAVLAVYEFPCYLVDGIVFISMGKDFLAKIMFAIVGVILLFIVGVILPKIKWYKHLQPSMGKIIALGIVLLSLFAYNELFNGSYSFDNIGEFHETKAMYEEFDDHFWPTKYIKHHSGMSDEDRIAIYPFDFTLSDGSEVLIYKGETFRQDNGDGTYELFYYPFTWKLYEGSDPVSLMRGGEKDIFVSGSDAVSQSDAPAQEQPAEGGGETQPAAE